MERKKKKFSNRSKKLPEVVCLFNFEILKRKISDNKICKFFFKKIIIIKLKCGGQFEIFFELLSFTKIIPKF